MNRQMKLGIALMIFGVIWGLAAIWVNAGFGMSNEYGTANFFTVAAIVLGGVVLFKFGEEYHNAYIREQRTRAEDMSNSLTKSQSDG